MDSYCKHHSLNGFSSQVVPVTGPIVQQLFNNSNSLAEVTYTVTPVLNGCTGASVSVIISIPNTSNCGVAGLFLPGSCIIDMGVVPQTNNNGLKPFGLLYELLNTNNIPVYWAINPAKTYVNPAAKVDQVDFSVDGRDFKGGPFIIPAAFVPQAQTIINAWVAQGVIVYYSLTGFTPPIYHQLYFLPKVVLDASTGDLIEDAFYIKAGIPSTAYTMGGIPTAITDCDAMYVMPHADPQGWAQVQKDALANFIDQKGWFFSACHAVSAIESISGGTPLKQLNFLSNAGLVLWGSHNDPGPPYNYLSSRAADPFMQFIGILDGALNSGSEKVYIPLAAGWRPSTTVSVWDPDYNLVPNSSPGPAALLAYGRAFGDPTKGMIMYMAGHSFDAGTVAEDVAAARVYGNFLLESSISSAPKIVPVSIPTAALSGQTVTFSATATSYLTTVAVVSYEWTSDCGGTFTSPNSPTSDFIVPGVNGITNCNIQLKVTDACGRKDYYCSSITITPTITNNHIGANQEQCAGIAPATLTGTIPVILSGDPFTYEWQSSTTSSAAGFGPASGINNTQNYSPGILMQTTWYRRNVISMGITVSSMPVEITVKPTPSVTASATPSTICAGQSTSLSSVGTGTFTSTITLINSSTLNIPDNSAAGNSNTINVSGLPAAMATNISVRVNVDHNTDQDIEIYLIRPGGSIINAPNGTYMNTTVPGESICLVADQGGNGNDFENTIFTDSAPISIVGQTAPFTGSFMPQENPFSSLTGNPNGNWTIKVVDDAGGTTGELEEWTLTMTYINNATYSWTSSPAGFTSSVQNPGNVSPTVSTTYTVVASELGNTCTASSSVSVTVNPTPVIPSQSSSICSGVNFFGIPSSPNPIPAGTTYAWGLPVVTGGITGATAQTGQPAIIQNLVNTSGLPQTATYTVTPTSGSAGACVGAPFTFTLTVNPLPSVALSAAPASICLGQGSTLTATNSNGTNQLVYSGTSAASVAIPNNNTVGASSVINLSTGSFAITPTDVIQVTLNITHPSDADLDIFLVAPSGTAAMLLSRDNPGVNYTNTVLRTNAVTPITAGVAPYTGTFLPQGGISIAPDRTGASGGGNYNAVIPANSLFGTPMNGNWTLRVFDDQAGNVGTLVNWSLSIIRPLGNYTSVFSGPPPYLR